MKEIKFKILYKGGIASDGMLDIYDAGVSIHGLSRALAITTHAFINKGDIRKRAERAEGAKIYIHPSRRGSFEELITIVISSDAAKNIGYSITAAAFWDFLKWTWAAAVGKDSRPKTPYVRKISESKELFIGEISTVLESSMEKLHRPIQGEEQMIITIERPQVGNIIQLDKDTLAYVSIRSESELIEDILGNVTKYNILSGFGRLFDDNEEKTISFEIDQDLSPEEKRLLTWSMDQRSQGKEGKLLIDVTRVLNAKNELKRYKVFAVRRASDGD
jgi:hypothetical protein